MQNRYIPPDDTNDIDKGVFDFSSSGRQYTDPKKCGKKGVVHI